MVGNMDVAYTTSSIFGKKHTTWVHAKFDETGHVTYGRIETHSIEKKSAPLRKLVETNFLTGTFIYHDFKADIHKQEEWPPDWTKLGRGAMNPLGLKKWQTAYRRYNRARIGIYATLGMLLSVSMFTIAANNQKPVPANPKTEQNVSKVKENTPLKKSSKER